MRVIMKVIRKDKKRQIILPLLHILRQIKPEYRIILLAHFDNATKDSIYEVITDILTTEKIPFEHRLKLKKDLSPYKNRLQQVVRRKVYSDRDRNKLPQIGGGPMTSLFDSALPYLLDLYKG